MKYSIHLILAVLLLTPSFLFCQVTFVERDFYLIRYDIVGKAENALDKSDMTKYTIPAGTKIYIEETQTAKVTFKVHTVPDNKSYPNCVVQGKAYTLEITGETPEYLFRHLSGFGGGIATTPFKYRPEKKNIYPGGNLAFAASYFYDFSGFTVKPVIFAGITTVSINQINSTEVENRTGFTTGFGFNFDVLDKVELGVIAGWDFVNNDWDSNGRVWYGVSFGFRIIN
ncbi:MAG: hypothetical protein ABSF91_11585 [Bacteroidota bacterium]|jgi:hypothetical protein